MPILRALGYSSSGANKIIRSKTLLHPFITIGSKRRPIQLVPDYLLSVNGNFNLVLDAKAPDEDIKQGDNVEQVYSYAIHPEIRVPLFALCNGKEFALYDVQDQTAVLCFPVSELEEHWEDLQRYIAPSTVLTTLAKVLRTRTQPKKSADRLPGRKAAAGNHRYSKTDGPATFRCPRLFYEAGLDRPDLCRDVSQPGDVVLDPYGGTGVTLVEALLLRRKAIHIDINPLSVFIVTNLIQPVNPTELAHAFHEIRDQYKAKEPKTDEEIKAALKRYPYPHDITLPKNSDVRSIEQLFTPKQLARLALLKHLIQKWEPGVIQDTLLLMFSGLLNKVNLTYHSSEGRSEGRGDSGIFRYYRYRIAPKPANIDMMKYFESRLKKVLAAKKEIAPFITQKTLEDAQVRQGTATDLQDIPNDSIDYIYTDPPYGSHIPYLDLSVMWNAWLSYLPVTKKDFENKAI